MDFKERTYSSLHEYLEAVLEPIPNPTYTDVIQAKRAYWKLYYARYRREKRKCRKEFTLGFDEEKLQLIHQKKRDLSVSGFLYQAVDTALNDTPAMVFDKKLLGQINQHLVQLIDLIEELLETNGTHSNEELLEKMDALANQFSQFFKTTQL